METNPTTSLDRARKIGDDMGATPNLGHSPMQNLPNNPPTKAALVKEPESHLGDDLGAALAGGDVGAAAQQGGVALNLWNSLPAAKSTDPAICHESEQAMNADGRRTRTVVLIEMALSTGPKTNVELAEITPRYGARVYDLRKLGYEIQTKRLADGVVQYSMQKGSPSMIAHTTRPSPEAVRQALATSDSDAAMDAAVDRVISAAQADLCDDQPRRTLDATVARMPDLRTAAAIPPGATNGRIRAATTTFNTRIFDDEGRCLAVICDGPSSHIDPSRQFTEEQCKANAARIVALWNWMDEVEKDRDRREKLRDNTEKPERDWERETQRDLDRDRG